LAQRMKDRTEKHPFGKNSAREKRIVTWTKKN